jgi:beta-glucosidase
MLLTVVICALAASPTKAAAQNASGSGGDQAGQANASAAPTAAAPKTSMATPAYLNPALPLDTRVHDLIGRMTLEEKASQLVNQARAIPRLGIPAYDWWNEGLHGVARNGVATVFPQAIALAATWDTGLLHSDAVAISTEARAKYEQAVAQGRRQIYTGLTFWSPNINIFRDPRWGRGQETYGEDPTLTGRMAHAFITGMQGDDARYLRVVATAKHFAVHSGPEATRHSVDVKVSPFDLQDTYLPAFRYAVTAAHATSVMCAYNAVDGDPACASRLLLDTELRHDWDFGGYVVSDCDAVLDIARGHHYVATEEEAVAIALKRGTDLECADYIDKVRGDGDFVNYIKAVHDGLLSEADIDRALQRTLRARFRLGLFDPPAMEPYANTPVSENDSAAHRELALQTARESLVLLKNRKMLPLAPEKIKRLAVIGPLADSQIALLGNYNGIPSRWTTVLDGIRRAFPHADVTYTPGTDFLHHPSPVLPTALAQTGEAAGSGLAAEYFANPNLAGTPAVTRTDDDVDFEYNGDPVPGVPMHSFSVRWTGELLPKETGDYRLGGSGDGGFRLYLNGALVLDDWKQQPRHTATSVVHLIAGQRYPLRFEYFETSGFPVAKLVWMRAGGETPEEALAAARAADAVLAVVGITSELEGEEMKVDVAGFSGGDRTSLDLPAPEQVLLEAVAQSKKPLAVVLMNGSALAVNWASRYADAILEAWYPGEEGGAAVGEALSGTYNPGGRLPITFYKSVTDLPPFDDYSMAGRTYRYFHGKPLYPFGFGLSYSRFSYSNLRLSSSAIAGGQPLDVDVDVTNTGPRDGDEVAELYLTLPKEPATAGAISPPPIGVPEEAAPSAPMPALDAIRALRAFQRVHLRAGETQHVQFQLDARDLSEATDSGARVVAPGHYVLTVGGGQPGKGVRTLKAKFKVTSGQAIAP